MIYYHFNIPTEGPFRCADTHMYSQLIYLHFGGSYTSFTQLEAEIHALEYKCASNAGPFSLLFLIPIMTYYFWMFFTLICLIIGVA